MSVEFSKEKLAEVAEIVKRYPEGRHKSALLPVLHMAQQEFGGWLDVPVMDYVASLLSIEPIEVYETTADGMFTLKTVECLGACGYAPMMQLGKHYREHLTKEKVDAIIEECRAKAN